MSTMDGDKYCLRWNEYSSNLSSAFNELRNDEDFFDITLITEESEIRCHKLILGACSPHFLQMIKRLNSQQNPAIYLRGVRHEDIKNILEFMYLGVVNVCQEDLDSFLSVAQDLCIKGLTQDDNYSPSASSSSRPSHQGVKRKYKSNNGDNVKTSYPKKEPKIEPEISLEHPDEHAIGQDEDIGEDYRDYGDYEAGPSGEDEEQLEKFKQKFAHLSEFFHLYEAIRGKNNVFSLRWKCNICESGQTIRSTSNAPTLNLKTHVSKLHPEHSSSFLTFREYNKISTSNNPVFVQEM